MQHFAVCHEHGCIQFMAEILLVCFNIKKFDPKCALIDLETCCMIISLGLSHVRGSRWLESLVLDLGLVISEHGGSFSHSVCLG